MSLYVVLFTSMGCCDYSITTFMLHFWTVQGYVIYWTILLFFFEKLSVSALLAFHRELADPAALGLTPTHSLASEELAFLCAEPFICVKLTPAD